VGRVARPPAPTPRRVSVTVAPTTTPSPSPLDEATLLRQPLSSGCATAQSVWIVTNGGGLLRYDGTSWSQPDGTLRSLTNVVCSQTKAYAVGLIGSLVIADELTRQISATDVSLDDLYGVSVLDDGALMVGLRGSVLILVSGDIQPYASGIDEDLRDVVAFSQRSAWAVGGDGITYRLDQRGWNPVGSGQSKTLRAVAARSAAAPIAVGDAGTIVGWDNGWRAFDSGVNVTLRDVIVDPALWIAGDAGTLLTAGGAVGQFRRVDLGTACDLVSVFARPAASEIWVVGMNAGAGGVWRLRADGTVAQHWGGC
jgi:hypothetical protein